MEHLGNPSGVYDGMCLSVVVQAKSRELGGGADWQWVKAIQEVYPSPTAIPR